MNIESAVAVNGGAAEAPSQGGVVLSRQVLPPSIVTTSWDDGDPCDLEIARMLADRKLSGTFYIPVRGHHRYTRMDRADMLALASQGFEIGAHGVSRSNLRHCDAEQLAVEVEISKKRLEEDLAKGVSMFAYPNGCYNANVIACVRRAGYTGARTTAMLARELAFDPYRMPTSVQAFPHSKLDYLKNIATSSDYRHAWGYLARLSRASHWVSLAMHMFDTVMDNGGVWHLYGHSWEINDFKLWDDLRVVLDYVANRPGALYLPNSEVVRLGKTQPIAKVIPCSAGL